MISKYYYEVAPASRSYHGSGLLTYSYHKQLSPGSVVEINVKNKVILGLIVKNTHPPSFKTKPLLNCYCVLTPRVMEIFLWLMDYYPSSVGSTASLFLPSGALNSLKKNAPKPVGAVENNMYTPTKDQLKVEESIIFGEPNTYIVHGETGSGKTKVYIDLSRKVLKKHQTILVLVPEIALSPQISREFIASFSDNVLIYHSNLSPNERTKVWQEVLLNKHQIIIGPRSSMFLPHKNLGLIIVDEFHEPAYKQESMPYYNSLSVAGKLSSAHKAPLIFGSATPPINQYYIAEQKNIPTLSMRSIADKSSTDISIVDLADTSEISKEPLLSNSLLTALEETIARKEQALIFLNKRGSSRLILCQNCGWNSKCKQCDLTLVYHQDKHLMICHTCGYSEKPPTVCKNCKSTNIKFKSPGTKAIENSLNKLFPHTKIARFDKDNLKADRIESKHKEIVEGKIDILVGTQILAKGHDLPKLGLVGILQAEAGLNFPDYTSNERTYQIIHQLIGRVGRGHRPGKVIIQSFTPDNPTIIDATKHSWKKFYNKEIRQRRAFGFPPFYFVMKITSSRASPSGAKQSLEKLTNQIKSSKVKIVGPSPCFVERKQDKFFWQIIIKSKSRSNLVQIAKNITGNYIIDIDPIHLL